MSLNAKAGSFTGSGSTGNQSITGLGFQPKLIIFQYNLSSSDGDGATFFFAFGAAVSASDRRVAGNQSLDNQATSANQAWNQNTTCIYAPGGSPRADFVSHDSDGFTINWLVSSTTVVNYLALGGADLTNVKTGVIASRTSTGTQDYTGLGFDPTCLLLFAGKYSTDNLDQLTNGAATIGFATGASERGYVAWRQRNNAALQVAKHRQSKTKVAASLTDSGVFAEVDFSAFITDGFRLNFTTAPTSADILYYVALRGPRVKVVSFNQATSTGNQALTGAGFTPKAAIMISANDTAANNDANNAHALVSMGMATGASERSCIWAGETDSTALTEADRHMDRTKAIKLIANGSLTVTGAADHVSFDSDGQTINWTTVDGTSREIHVLWLGDAPTVQATSPGYASTPGGYF